MADVRPREARIEAVPFERHDVARQALAAVNTSLKKANKPTLKLAAPDVLKLMLENGERHEQVNNRADAIALLREKHAPDPPTKKEPAYDPLRILAKGERRIYQIEPDIFHEGPNWGFVVAKSERKAIALLGSPKGRKSSALITVPLGITKLREGVYVFRLVKPGVVDERELRKQSEKLPAKLPKHKKVMGRKGAVRSKQRSGHSPRMTQRKWP